MTKSSRSENFPSSHKETGICPARVQKASPLKSEEVYTVQSERIAGKCTEAKHIAQSQ